MEQKNSSPATTILSLIAILILVVFVIVMAVKGLSKDDDTNDVYSELRQGTTIAADTPTPTEEPQLENVPDITELLDSLTTDLTNYLQCTNPNIMTFSTPGLTLEKLGSMRTALGQSTVETWNYWKADYTNSTTAVKGDYVINFNLGTAKGSKKLYVYVWTDNRNGFYVSMIAFEIGDF